MGKRGAWFTAVKRAIICESKEKREKKSRKSQRWFGKQRSIGLDSSEAEKTVVVAPTRSPMQDVKLMEAENEQNRHAYSVALVTAMAAEAAVAAANAAAEVVRLRTAAACNSGNTKEEIAAVKIQTAFRGYLARRALGALRGLVRLKSLVRGQSVRRQSASTLKCMQTLARIQSEVRARRIRLSEETSAVQRQMQQQHEKELQKPLVSNAENWDDSTHSKEKIDANLQQRREAAMRRERALAYAYSHQQTFRNSSTSRNQMFTDPNNPGWGWSWLEQWMANRTLLENMNNAVDKEPTVNDHSRSSPKIQSPAAQKHNRPSSRQSPLTPKSKIASKMTDDDSKSMISTQSERGPRQSIAGSSVRDDESFASSPAIPGYMASTESARAKSRLSTSSPVGSEKLGGSVKKRLSFSSSPGGLRRHSAPMKGDLSHVNDVALSS
ncbi:hypothetical protein CDL12_16258 [Handroanthus impetiginosus]|uniref:DUF4005 domain-containing protein n=1 Tax=Handroanthus impetiginosus TaxID=429701 RepID=A0A2G9H0V6_9LAMI|nr:hypothetical protein CDL12_16258 [Handroanthus impetiginosus]